MQWKNFSWHKISNKKIRKKFLSNENKYPLKIDPKKWINRILALNKKKTHKVIGSNNNRRGYSIKNRRRWGN